MSNPIEMAHAHSRRRFRWLTVWVTISAVVAVAAFLGGTLLRSPWQSAVQNSEASVPVTTTVRERTIDPAVAQASGTVSMGTLTTVPVPSSDSARTVVTKTYARAGSVVMPGEALIGVSGRPIIALTLTFPLYRDLVPGDTGDDVREVQQELSTLGDFHGAIDGVYGAGTSAAVRELYERADTTPPSASADLLSAEANSTGSSGDTTGTLPATIGQPQTTTNGSASTDGSTSNNSNTAESGGDGSSTTSQQQAYADAKAAADTPLPMAEVQEVPAAGATVVSVQSVGATPSGDNASLAVLRSGTPDAVARVGVEYAKQLAVGTKVTVQAVTNTSQTATGVVRAVSGFQAATATELPGYDITVTFSPGVKIPFTGGTEIQVQPSTAPRGVTGLSVPVIAVREDGAASYVMVVEPKGKAKRVNVTTGLSEGGYILITAQSLHAGNEILISGSLHS